MAFDITPFVAIPNMSDWGGKTVADQVGADIAATKAAYDVTKLNEDLTHARAMYPIELNVAKMRAEAAQLDLDRSRALNSAEMIELSVAQQKAAMEAQKRVALDQIESDEYTKTFYAEFGGKLGMAQAAKNTTQLLDVFHEAELKYPGMNRWTAPILTNEIKQLDDIKRATLLESLASGKSKADFLQKESDKIAVLEQRDEEVHDTLGVSEYRLLNPKANRAGVISAMANVATKALERTDLSPRQREVWQHIADNPDPLDASRSTAIIKMRDEDVLGVNFGVLDTFFGFGPKEVALEADAFKHDFLTILSDFESKDPKARADAPRVLREFISSKINMPTQKSEDPDVQRRKAALTKEAQAFGLEHPEFGLMGPQDVASNVLIIPGTELVRAPSKSTARSKAADYGKTTVITNAKGEKKTIVAIPNAAPGAAPVDAASRKDPSLGVKSGESYIAPDGTTRVKK